MLPNRTVPFTLLLLLLLLLGLAAADAQGQRPKSRARSGVVKRVPAAPSPEAARRLETFQKVWQVLNEYYFDRTFNNLNWASIKAEYEPRARAAKTDAELYRILDEMLDRLGSSHLAIIRPEVFEEIERAKAAAKVRQEKYNSRLISGAASPEEDEEDPPNFDDPLARYGIGIDLRILNGQFVITRIKRNSAAEYAGLKTGFVIEKVNELSLPELLLRLTVYGHSRSLMNQLPEELVTNFINGEKDTSVDLTYLDQGDVRKQVSIQRELLKGQTISVGKNFPEKRMEFEAEPLNDETAYIRFSQFAMPVIEKFCAAIGQFRDKKGLIIDLRGNSGGIIASAIGLGGMLTETQLDLGASIYKTGEERLLASPKLKNYKGRIVLLVDETTASAAEMFAVSFQESGRALVVGEKTAGATLPSTVIDLPTGAVMQYPIANYRSGKGAFLEGKGITPNFVVSLDRKSLVSGTDTQMQKALSLIAEDKAFAAAKLPPDFKGPVNFIGDSTRGSGPAPPPPPPPKKAPPLSAKAASDPPLIVLAEVTVKAPPPLQAEVKSKDPTAVKVIEAFIQLAGGRDAIEKLDSYEISGNAELSIRGSAFDFDYSVFRKASDKYAEIMSSPSLGEIRQVYNGRSYLTQADYGVSAEFPVPAAIDTSEIELLGPIRMLVKPDAFSSLKYAGTYDRDGRKVHLIDAQSKRGTAVALAFDVETKMLSYFTGVAYGIIFSDYRKVGGLTLPFGIERERLMRLKFNEIKINTPIDDSRFTKKINCYDVPN